MSEGYTQQLATMLRAKTAELSWLVIEVEARLALSREWTEEARAAGEKDWMRYSDDIELLETALRDAREMLLNANALKKTGGFLM